MKIYSYDNPYKITDTSFWGGIADYPHLCVSQTLVEGMKKQYGRDAFWYIDTIDAFINDFYQNWSDHPETQIKQYLSITAEIKNIHKGNINKAMRFNQKEIHNAIRFLMELGIKANQFNQDVLTEEQRILLQFVEHLQTKEEWTLIEALDQKTIEDVKDSFLELLKSEMERNQRNLMDISGRQKRELEKTVKFLEALYEEYSESINEHQIPGIVFHGIHQFTPINLKLIHHLEKLGIEVIFLINYHPSYSNIFYTWDKVYRWTSRGIGKDQNKNNYLSFKNELGKAIGGLLEGEIQDWDFSNIKFFKYDNLTTFADEIAEKFKQASLSKDGKQEFGSMALSRMNEQFYATNNEDINKILQAYFPEQFGDRHFLSYPIGQFILGLYNMWDEREKTLKITTSILKECLSVNFFRVEDQPAPLEILNKIELYFIDVDTIDQFRSRLHDLIEKVRVIEIRNDDFHQDLRSFSFFNVTYSELQYFSKVIHDLYEITRQLFGQNHGGYINYKDHYKQLIEIIQNRSSSSPYVSSKEKELVDHIKEQFENIEELEIDGTIDDLKETIHFYLQKRDIRNSANWIVRNFEQIDGGVLLSNKGKAKNNKYHLTMLSDQKMKVGISDRLSWPLTKGFFDAYQDEVTDLEIVMTSLSEYSNFLRYSLFYATYYLDNQLILSYVENSEGEKDNPYFLLDMLEISPNSENIDSLSFSKFDVDQESSMDVKTVSYTSSSENFETVELQKFSTCSYRFLLDEVIEETSYYQGEYHCKLYYTSILLKNAWSRIDQEHLTKYEEVVKQESQKLKPFFPFWQKIDFFDVEAIVLQNINQSIAASYRFDPYYLQLRQDFLYALVKEDRQDDSRNLIYDIHKYKGNRATFIREQTAEYITSYLDNNDLDVSSVNPSICNYCKQREICLHHFKEVG
jgi:hypothetical protein